MSSKTLILLFLIFFGGIQRGISLNPTVGADSTSKDTTKSKEIHSPKTATILAMALPGAGQIYNHKYWKVPIVWGALAYSGYQIFYNQHQMQTLNDTFRAMYARGLTPDPLQRSKRDNFRENRDASIIALSVIYVLQIVDATVDAHFFKFDINQKLSAQFHPNPMRILSFSYQIK